MTRRIRGTLLIVAAREVYEHLWNPLVWVLVFVASVLAAVATHVGIERLSVAASQQHALHEQRDQDRAKNGGRVFGHQLETALRVIRPPETLSVVAAGVDSVVPQFWDFGPSGVRIGRVPADSTIGQGNTGSNVDLELLIRIVVGLLAIALAVETIAGERASGALLALLGQPVRPRQVLAGKLAGGTVTLTVAIAIAGLVALVTSAVTAPSLVSSDYLASLVAICVSGVLYAFICFAAGVLVSIIFSSYRLALTATFVVWVIGALMAQPAAVVIAQSMFPVQPQSAAEAERERFVHAGTSDVQNRMGDEYAVTLGGRETWLQHRDDARMVRAARERAEPLWTEYVTGMRRRLEEMSVARDAIVRRQRQTARLLSRLNPAAEFSAAATNLAGTGGGMAERWDSSVARYQLTLEQRLFDDRPGVYALTPWVDSREPGKERRATVLLERRPSPVVTALSTFEPPQRDFRQRLRDASPHVLTLIVYAVTLVMAALAAFERLRF